MPKNGKLKGPPPEGRANHAPQGPLKDAADRAGIVFSGKADRYPNTVKAHTLMQFAELEAGRETQNTLMEVLFRQYFTDGLYPDEANLQAAAEEVGLDVRRAMAALSDGTKQDEVRFEAAANSKGGVSSVPFFVIDGHKLGGGAKPPNVFENALLKLAEIKRKNASKGE